MSTLHSGSWSRSGGRTPRMSPMVISGSQAAMSHTGVAFSALGDGVNQRRSCPSERVFLVPDPPRSKALGNELPPLSVVRIVHVDLHRNRTLIRAGCRRRFCTGTASWTPRFTRSYVQTAPHAVPRVATGPFSRRPRALGLVAAPEHHRRCRSELPHHRPGLSWLVWEETRPTRLIRSVGPTERMKIK